jgi:pimeloyl-ACP methyl ester carboxylesterase
MKLHALLVGINFYESSSGVPPLNGCINDVKSMVGFLEQRFDAGQRNIKTLLNQEATRSRVIAGFRENLIGEQIAAGDIVLFYYSGHGSYAPSAPEFVALGLDTAGQDETLVLYDSRLDDNFDLADKELALLLSAINQDASIVVVLDSCHSGSATRSTDPADDIRLGSPRFAPKNSRISSRTLQQYLHFEDWDYGKMGRLHIPVSKHLLLAACGRNELAYEAASPNGLFTGSLLQVLQQWPDGLSYDQLHDYLYTIIKRQANRQTPQLKVYGGFDSRLYFLGDRRSGGGQTPGYRVSFDGQDWVLNSGALHGITTDPATLGDIKVGLYSKGGHGQIAATGVPVKTRLTETVLRLEADLPVTEIFEAGLINHPPSLCVYVRGGGAAAFFQLEQGQRTNSSSLLFHDDARRFYDVVLDTDADELRIFHAKSPKLLHGVRGIDGDRVAYIIEALVQIAKWRNLEVLENPQAKLASGEIEFALQIKEQGKWVDCIGTEITLAITEQRPEIPFRLRLATSSDPGYFVAIYRLSPTFAIEKYTEDVDASRLTSKDVPAILCNKADNEEPAAFEMDPANNEETEIYKLVVSREIFYDYFLEESRELRQVVTDFKKARAVKGVKPGSRGDWMTVTLRIRLVRQSQKIDKGNGFSNSVLSIRPHPAFEAAVSITAVDNGAKSYNPAAVLQSIFQGNGFSFLRLGSTGKGDQAFPQTVIELSGISNELQLQANPLRLDLAVDIAENEQVMAVTYIDGLVISLGLVQQPVDSKDHCFYLYDAPVETDPRREAGKSPARALWFCFMKLVLRKEDAVFKLRPVFYKAGKVDYCKKSVAEAMEGKKNVLLLIHGIIGNTASIAANLEFLLEGAGQDYDLLIAFDYENLNTEIGDIARELRDRLVAAGVGPDRKVDILAHSMGGLVGRYFVEQLGGDKMIDRLFLVGTPNGGSNFGEIAVFRKWANGILTVVCNVGKHFLGHFGPFLEAANKVLGASGVVMNTLEQMNVGSKFLKELNEAPKALETRYYVLAGNTASYDMSGEPVAKRIMDKIELAIGKLAYWKVENDIAVSVHSIGEVPAVLLTERKEVGCHHLNYFENDKSLATLKQLFSKKS